MSKSKLVVIVCRNISPPLRHMLNLFLIEVAPLTFAGRLSYRTKNKLWDLLQSEYSGFEISMIESINANENGFDIKENMNITEKYTTMLDGLLIGVRHFDKKPVPLTVLGKSIPTRYPLVRHLLDTSAMAEVLLNNLSDYQKKVLKDSLVPLENKDLNLDSILKNIVSLAAGIHDIGKANPAWLLHTLHLLPDDASLQGYLKLPISVDPDSDIWRHDIMGGIYIEQGGSSIPENLKSVFIEVITSHHGDFRRTFNFQNVISKSSAISYALDPDPVVAKTESEKWIVVQQEIEKTVIDTLEININNLKNVKDILPAGRVLITALIILADWIVSRDEYINEMVENNFNSEVDHYKASQEVATRTLTLMGLESPVWAKNLTWDKIFPHILTPNTFQQTLIDNSLKLQEPGLTLINAPMGYGKTESALYLASIIGSNIKNSGFWVTLPTQATANALFDRATDIASKIYVGNLHSVSLMHSNSLIAEQLDPIPRTNVLATDLLLHKNNISDSSSSQAENDESRLFVSEFLTEKKKGGMSSVAVSTIDQLLSVCIPLKHNMLQWLAITGKTLILDEIHDFDSYTFGLIKKLVGWCGVLKIPVIAMSATLNAKSQKELFEAYLKGAYPALKFSDRTEISRKNISETGMPNLSWLHLAAQNIDQPITKGQAEDSKELIEYSTTIEITDKLTLKVIELLDAHFGDSDEPVNVLLVANTVNQAISLYREIATWRIRHQKVILNLLHSRMPDFQKQKVISHILQSTGKRTSDNMKRIPQITVATQIIQQSMDIDYDVLITVAAPLPQILQRVGRVHRHDQGSFRAEKYRNNPFVHIIVEESIQACLDKKTPEIKQMGTTPYSKWEILVTIDTLEKYFAPFSPSATYKWKAKATIQELFNLSYERGEVLRLDSDHKIFYDQANNLDAVKSDKSEYVSINDSSTYHGWLRDLNLTASYTSLSRQAAQTRLFEETTDFVFVAQHNGEWKIVENGAEPISLVPLAHFSKDLRKQLAKNTLSVLTFSSLGKILNLTKTLKKVPEFEKYEKYLKFIDYSQLKEQLKYDTIEEGLTYYGEIPKSNGLWI